MIPPDELWTFDYYTCELGAAAAALDQLLGQGEVTSQQVWALVAHFPPARQPAAYTLLVGLQARTALQKYAMQIEADKDDRRSRSEEELKQQEREIRTSNSTVLKPRRSWLRWSVASALVVVVLLSGGWFARRKVCIDVTVPASHFVKQKGNRKVIIFVHGVLGDVDNTWVNANTHSSWPDLISNDPQMADFDVYVYGYKSSCGGDTSNINEIAARMGQQLEDDEFFSKYEEIDFIAHSMGGLITKSMLAALNTPAESSKLQLVHTVLFIAVPAAGAPVASLATWLSDNPQFKNMNPVDSQAFLQSIDQGWNSMARERSPAHPYPYYFVAYETGDIASLRIVPALYTSTNSDLPPIAFDYNHSTIVKPSGLDDPVYKWSRARILVASK
jgi:pimeloyl-ACP methyl ester carboxylesterase